MLEMRASSRLRANRNYNTAGSVKRMGRVGEMMQIIQSFATCTSPMMHLIWPARRGGGGGGGGGGGWGATLSKMCKW